MLGRVMAGAKAWIDEVALLDDIGLAQAPHLEFMAKKILAELPELQGGLVVSQHALSPDF